MVTVVESLMVTVVVWMVSVRGGDGSGGGGGGIVFLIHTYTHIHTDIRTHNIIPTLRWQRWVRRGWLGST
jgi:hypothetical protein